MSTDATVPPTDAAPRVATTWAMFEHETAAHEAMGLLAFHGFRSEGLRLVPARGARVVVAPGHVVRDDARSARAMTLGGAVAALLGAGALLVVHGPLPLGLPPAALPVGTAAVGALGGALTVPSARSLGRQVVEPDHGVLLAVRSLRSEEARQLLDRSGGIAVDGVEPVATEPSEDVEQE